MGRKIICEACSTIFQEDVLGDNLICPVCGKPLVDDLDIKDEKKKFYYYKSGGGGLIDFEFEGEKPLYTFEAVNLVDAEKQLQKVMPNSSLFQDNITPETRCPRCGSKEIQLVPRKFSMLTGFATNRYDRMCVYCKKKF